MTKTTETLKLEISQLALPERAKLAYFLIDSLDEDVQDNVWEDWDIELTQRLAEIQNATANGEPSDKLLGELRQKYS